MLLAQIHFFNWFIQMPGCLDKDLIWTEIKVLFDNYSGKQLFLAIIDV